MMSFYLSGGVEVLGFISPTEPTDEYPVIDPLYGIDGFRNVNTLSDLNSIPNLRRRAGMVVGVSGGTQYYKLNPLPWNGTITDWSTFNSGSGGGTFTGGTVTGDTIFTQGLTATTFSAATYLGLPLDVYVTGGTYSNGTITFTNNSSGTFNVIGLSTGTTINLSGGTGISVSGTSPNFIVENTLPDQVVSISGGTNIKITGTYPNFAVEFTGTTSGSFTGGTVTGDTIFTQGVTATTFSASTYLGLPLDVYVTGGTYSNGTLTFTNNSGGTFNVTGLSTGTTINLSGGTGISISGTSPDFIIDNTLPDQIVSLSGGTNIKITGTYPNFGVEFTGVTSSPFTGGTVTGDTIFTNGLTANTLTVNGVSITGDTYTTGGTYSNGTITFDYNTGGGYQVVGLYTGETSYVNSLTTGTGLSADTTTGNITIINTDPDQVVTISGGTNVDVTGTYPNFNITLTGLSDNNIYTTGFTYSANTFYIIDTSGNTFSATIDVMTGLTINGVLSATTLNVNGVSITGDTYTTGGTYSNGTLDFYNNNGGSYQVTGLYTGQTSYVNSLTTGVGLSGDSTTGNVTIINTDPDQVVSISGGTGILTGGTYPNFTIENSLPDQTVVLNNGTNISVTGTYPNFTIDVTGLTDNNTYTTGFTYNNNTFTISDSSGNTLNATINSVTGLTVNGNLTVTGNTLLQSISGTSLDISGNSSSDLVIITQTGSGNSFVVEDSSRPDSTPFIINSNGNTSIGSSAYLTSAGGIPATLQISNGSAGAITLPIISTPLAIQSNSSTTVSIFSPNAGLSQLTFGSPSDSYASIFRYTPNITQLLLSTTTSGGVIDFQSGTGTFAMRINNNQNIGIGTTSPQARLHVANADTTLKTGLFSGTGQNILTVVGSGNTTSSPIFTVQGSSGELFSVSDSLIGSLFSVNDISGLPILEVFSDNTTLMGSYLAPSLNTTSRVIATTGTTNVYSIPTSAYTGAFFDYTVSDGTNLRAGNIMSIWSGTSVNYTETQTTDFGNTSGLTFNMVVSSGTAILRTSGATGNWTVKTIVRSI